MIPIQSADRVVTQNSNVGRSMNYRLDARNLRHIVTMLRDSVYSNKILAVIREYSTNALDAHAAAEEAGSVGHRTKPIEVHLPTKFAPELRIRDFGPGLSEKEIEEVYISLGESTKRQSNKFVGSLGFGSKSAFAYGDRFIITSWNGGRKAVYNSVLDDAVPEGARCDIMAEAPCDDGQTGIEICIPIKQGEIDECKQVALNFFKYWTTFPVMTGANQVEIDSALAFKKTQSIFSGQDWVIYPREHSYSNSSKGIALMGDVPYTLDWELVKRKLTTTNVINATETILFDFIQANNTILTFAIGQLEFSVSRETLQYTDYTCKAIFDRVLLMFNSIQKIIEKAISDAPNLWEAKRLYGIIFNSTNFGYGDLDSEKSQFSGELRRLEGYFKGKLKWNNILIESHQFSGIGDWETSKGKVKDGGSSPYYRGYDPEFKCILTSFHDDHGKLRKGLTRRRRYSSDNGVIMPSKHSVVVINDLDKPHGFLTIIRYLLQNTAKTEIKRAYTLNFGNDTVKTAFYKEYSFDTVPVIYASAMLAKAKTWYATVKPATTYAGGAPTGPLQVRTLSRDIAGTKKFGGTRSWYKRDVKLKDLDKVTYYVPVDGDEILNLEPNRTPFQPYYFVEYMVGLDSSTDWLKKIDVIYGILPRTAKAKWFLDAKKAGRFINLFEYIKEKIKTIDLTQLAESRRYFEYTQTMGNYVREMFVASRVFADALFPHLKFKDSKIHPLCLALRHSYADLMLMDGMIKHLGFTVSTDAIKSSTDYKGMMTAANKQYPLMDLLGRQLFRTSTPDAHAIKALAHYINLIDDESGCKIPA